MIETIHKQGPDGNWYNSDYQKVCQHKGCDKVIKRDKFCHSHSPRKNYTKTKYTAPRCENWNGSVLGFSCGWNEDMIGDNLTREEFLKGLTVDHWDGDHSNDDPDNLVVLCAACHNVKTFRYGDYLPESVRVEFRKKLKQQSVSEVNNNG